jgi:hypothetical protein
MPRRSAWPLDTEAWKVVLGNVVAGDGDPPPLAEVSERWRRWAYVR